MAWMSPVSATTTVILRSCSNKLCAMCFLLLAVGGPFEASSRPHFYYRACRFTKPATISAWQSSGIVMDTRKAGIRWTIGDVSDPGFEALELSIRSARKLFEIGRHTSELQSHVNLVCRLLLEKKKTK